MQTSIGQGNTLVSPMHMALIVSAIANDGVLMKPYYIQQVQNVNGDVVSKTKTSEYKTLMTKEEASRLKQLMQEVVNRGTASALSGEVILQPEKQALRNIMEAMEVFIHIPGLWEWQKMTNHSLSLQ